MNKNLEKVLAFLDATQTYYLATVEGDQPRVRPFASVTEYEKHIYLCSGKQKEFYKQVLKNPKVELCGMYEDGSSWLRVSGTLLEDNRYEVQEYVLDDPTGPKGLYKPGDGNFVTFKLTNAVAYKYSFTSSPVEIKEYE